MKNRYVLLAEYRLAAGQPTAVYHVWDCQAIREGKAPIVETHSLEAVAKGRVDALNKGRKT